MECCCFCLGIAIAFLAAILKIYIKLNTRWNNSNACLVGKTVIVTGANTGLGYATALDFAMRGARLILACRSRERAEDARRRIVSATGNENVFVRILDLASFESVRAFADDFNKTESRLDILVNNAGMINTEDTKSVDGLPTIMQVNHLSPFLLTHLLIDKLKNTPSSRIVNMSSYLAKISSLRSDKLGAFPQPKGMLASGTVAYSDSKLCNLLFTIELEKKLENTGIRTFCVHPGGTKTEIRRNDSSLMRFITTIVGMFIWTAEEGAQTTIYCSLSKEVEGYEGAMFGNCKKLGLYEAANDVTLAKEVWKKSEELVHLTDSEKMK